MIASRLALLVCGCALAGCVPPVPEGFTSPDPNRRIDAIIAAAEQGDRSAIRALIVQLDSSDAAARVLASRTLERLTGETHGYDPYGSERERGDAIERWAVWISEQDREGAESRRDPPTLGDARGRSGGAQP